MTRFAVGILAMFAVVAALPGCATPRDVGQVDKIRVLDGPTLRTDEVGPQKRVTFALVDAENTADTELLVTMTGHLVDATGRPVGELRRESLRVPAGGRRTFALVDRGMQERREATTAQLAVASATVPSGPSRVQIHDGHVYADQGRVVVAGNVVNEADKPSKAIVIAGFHDEQGKPMTRPFTVFELGGNVTRPARFVGPPGSKTGYIFVGDIVY